jgi:small subunit ribosomal protein S13
LADKNEQSQKKIEDSKEDTKEKISETKKIQEKHPISKERIEEEKVEKVEEPEELSEFKEREPVEKKLEPSVEKKSDKVDLKKEKSIKKKDEKDSDFNYIVRIANTDIDGEKKITFGLTQIKGVGRRMATLITDAAGIDREIKCGNLTESQLVKINEVLENLDKKAPAWMLNHRKDLDTGKDIHLISTDVEMRLRDEINLLKMIRSYRGIRHETGLTVRGQRTRSNSRKGLALGVSKKGKSQ